MAAAKAKQKETHLNKLFSFDMKGKTIDPDATIAQAMTKMVENRSHCLLVKGLGERPVGVLSEHDIISALTAETGKGSEERVHRLMTIDIIAVRDTDTVDDALKIIAEHNIHYLPVLTEDGNVVDFLSVMDLLVKKSQLGL